MSNALETLFAALQAKRGLDYYTEWDAYMTALTAAQVEVGARLVGTSTTSAAIGTGSKSLTVQTDKNFAAGQYVIAYQTSATENFMIGVVTSYNDETGVLAFTVASGDTGGGGTITDWTVSVTGRRGATGSAGSMTGPASSTDNVWPRFNGAGGTTLQNGTWTEADTGNVTAGGDLDMSGYDLTVDLVTVEAAGENAEGNATNATGEVTLQATGTPVLRHTLTGDVTYLVAGAPTAGKGWQVEVRPTQDGTGGRDVTILPVNQLTYSGDLRSTAETGSPAETRPWTDTNTSLSLNAAAGPDGQTTLTKLIADATNSTHFRQAAISGLAPTQTLSASAIVKDGGAGLDMYLSLISDTGLDGYDIAVNPATGAVLAQNTYGTAGAPTYAVTAVANGCYRIDITGLIGGAGANCTVSVYLSDGVTSTFLGDGASGVYIGEIQVNKGSPVGIAHVGATRAGMVTWRVAADEIDFAAQAASTASRILISYGSDGEILVDDVSLVS